MKKKIVKRLSFLFRIVLYCKCNRVATQIKKQTKYIVGVILLVVKLKLAFTKNVIINFHHNFDKL